MRLTRVFDLLLSLIVSLYPFTPYLPIVVFTCTELETLLSIEEYSYFIAVLNLQLSVLKLKIILVYEHHKEYYGVSRIYNLWGVRTIPYFGLYEFPLGILSYSEAPHGRIQIRDHATRSSEHVLIIFQNFMCTCTCLYPHISSDHNNY